MLGLFVSAQCKVQDMSFHLQYWSATAHKSAACLSVRLKQNRNGGACKIHQDIPRSNWASLNSKHIVHTSLFVLLCKGLVSCPLHTPRCRDVSASMHNLGCCSHHLFEPNRKVIACLFTSARTICVYLLYLQM